VKVLIVRLGSLGDIVHTVPVAAALRAGLPDARLDWLVDDRYAAILDHVPAVQRRVVISPARALRADRPGHAADVRFSGRAGLVGAIRWMRRQQYDAVIDLQGLIKSAVLARASGATRIIGFERAHLRERQARAFYTETVTPRADLPRHVVFKNLSALGAFGLSVPPSPAFPIDVPLSPALDTVRRSLDAASLDGFALINPGAAWPNKRWPAERFGQVASALRRSRGLGSVVSWGPGEEGLAARVVEASGGAAVMAPPTGVGDLLAISRASQLAVSGDTGPLHVAAAAGAPVVAVFGPTDPARNGPWAPDDVSLSRFADCVCHYERRCRRSRPCIEDITVEDVLAAIERRLANRAHAHA
jgi:heptosyltransferase I